MNRRTNRPYVASGIERVLLLQAVALAALLCASPDRASGQQQQDPNADPNAAAIAAGELSERARQAKVQAIQQESEIPQGVREAALGSYEQAKAPIAQAQVHRQQAQQIADQVEQAPDQIDRLQEQIRKLDGNASQPPEEVADGNDLTLDQINARVEQLEFQRTDLQTKLDELDTQVRDWNDLQARLPKLLADTKTELADVRQKLTELPASEDHPAVKDARRFLLRAREKSLSEALDLYEKQSTAGQSIAALLQTRQGLLSRKLQQLEQRLSAWSDLQAERKRLEDQRRLEQVRQAAREAAGSHPAVKQLADTNEQLAELGKSITTRREDARRRLETVNQRLTKIQESFGKVRSMEQRLGKLTQALGLQLRDQRSRLPDLLALRRRAADRRAEMSDLLVRLSELRDMSSELANLDETSRRLLREAQPPVPEDKKQQVLQRIKEQLADRRDVVKLPQLTQDVQQYSLLLTELDTAEKDLIREAEAYAQYIDERVLWIRSTAPLGPADVAQAVGALGWLFGVGSWQETLGVLRSDAADNPFVIGLAALVILGLLVVRRRVVSAADALHQRVSSDYPGTFRSTLIALPLTILPALPLPLLVWVVGWRLASAEEATRHAFVVGQGLMAAGLFYLPVAMLRHACRTKGLGESHFRWRPEVTTSVSRMLLQALVVGAPLVALTVGMEHHEVETYATSLGRLAATVGLILLALLLAVHLRPRGKLISLTVARRSGSLIYRLRLVWYPLAVGLPLALAAMAVLGYYYTTYQLSGRLLSQLWVVAALLVLHSLLMRWLLVAQRRLAIESSKRRQEQQQRRREQLEGAEPPPELEEPELDMSSISQQTRKLVRSLMMLLLAVSFYFVWIEVLPALGILRHVTLWSAGDSAISLVDVLLSLAVVLVTVVAARNLPGLLEISLLRRLHLEAGGRYAIAAIARYIIFVVGVVVAFDVIGIGWDSVQWLVAAMTVGLGFGLQEIFANFVSGLIILLERPVRVGDVVTVGGVSGTVTRIRMRATTITDWDRKELIVPNKEFITQQLINWTLSDSVIRVVVPVGIAYGSDTQLARDLLLEVAAENDRVREDPAPLAFFMEFGGSSLNFELRVYVSGLDDYLRVRNDLHMAIDRKFRKAGIEIAFPQQDIHIRSIKAALPVRQDSPAPDKPNAADPPEDI